jgi:hypothetical protein
VAWIRRVRTASGATAVQIAEYVGGRRKILAHVGSAHTEAELGILLEQARGLLVDDGQDTLDVQVERSPVRVDLVGQPAAEVGLFTAGTRTVTGMPGSCVRTERVAQPRVIARASRLLFDTLAGVYDDLGFDVVSDEVFRDLVIARIVEPTSILDTARVLTDLGRTPASEKTMRRTLARCVDRVYRDKIAEACFAHALSVGDVSLVLYDVTTLYFEAEKEDDLRKVGYSKERRVDPQIVVGLLVDRTGFPLEIGCYEGNKAETQTIVPIVKQFQQRHGLTDNGRRRGRRDVVRDQSEGDRRGRPEVHRRIARHQGTHRSSLPLPLARRRVHRRPADRHHHPEEPQGHRERPDAQG